MEATSREAAPAKSSASGPSAPPALFELCGRAVSAHMGVLESGVWGKSRSEGLPPAASGGGPAARGRGGRGREARGKAQPGALQVRLSSRSMNSLTGGAGQSEDGDPVSKRTRTTACRGGRGGRGQKARCGAKAGRALATGAGLAGRSRRLGTDTGLSRTGPRRLGCRTDGQGWPGCPGAGADIGRPGLRQGGQARSHLN